MQQTCARAAAASLRRARALLALRARRPRRAPGLALAASAAPAHWDRTFRLTVKKIRNPVNLRPQTTDFRAGDSVCASKYVFTVIKPTECLF